MICRFWANNYLAEPPRVTTNVRAKALKPGETGNSGPGSQVLVLVLVLGWEMKVV